MPNSTTTTTTATGGDTAAGGHDARAASHQEVLPGGATWSMVLRRGTTLTVTDPDGGACATTTLLAAAEPTERYCMADTLKAQHTWRLTAGDALFSDMGRVLASVTADVAGAGAAEAAGHDAIGGLAHDALLEPHLGARAGGYQRDRNGTWRSARDGLLGQLAVHGLGRRDVGDVVNLHGHVAVDAAGRLTHAGPGGPGAAVTLRLELDALVIVHAGLHPLDEGATWPPSPVRLALGFAAPPGAEDPVRRRCPENARGLALSERAALWSTGAPGAGPADWPAAAALSPPMHEGGTRIPDERAAEVPA